MMDADWTIVAVLALWFGVNYWVLPRLGVRT